VLFFAGHESPQATAPNPALGNLLGVSSGIFWAFTVAGLRWLGRDDAGGRAAGAGAALLGNTLAFALCLPWALPLGPPVLSDWLVVAYLGVFQIGLAYVLLTKALRRVPAFEAALLLLLEPALNPVWAYAVHGERPGPWALAGGAVILAATAVHSWRSAPEPA
jgi:drug/metabolite transporter (DMT)-like permease